MLLLNTYPSVFTHTFVVKYLKTLTEVRLIILLIIGYYWQNLKLNHVSTTQTEEFNVCTSIYDPLTPTRNNDITMNFFNFFTRWVKCLYQNYIPEDQITSVLIYFYFYFLKSSIVLNIAA